MKYLDSTVSALKKMYALLKQFIAWLNVLIFGKPNIYQLVVWYVHEDYESDSGVKVKKRTAQRYELKKIIKKTNKHILAVTVDDAKLEIKTVEPFDYEIKKIQ